ncbi:hypothetical protein SLEP1_g31945 [Rubroshorea leprosula]|uniref:Leucine-rich repeat-containing N-terminal plant-type domain-containing protein n=1 Tax=Rubroshorea leprosula TaxID=152421 RepID=A0AAV5KBV0_9ROSI|nr:hypothetical protein SLEP1_g31945 [Rubroshorea leprosula]
MTPSLFSLLFTLLLTTIFYEINVVLVSGHCQSYQKELLLQLKNKLVFYSSSSLKLVKWNQSLDCCMWKGVTCDVRGRVIDLDLSNEWIFDGIDDSSNLFNLQHLQSLNLANNDFNSNFPSGFDKLLNLRHLNLSNAGFTGQIPVEISRMKSLVTLDLSVDADFYLGLKLEKPNLVILVQNLKELRHLHLDGVNILAQGKEWCQTLSSLASLQVLSMSNCNLSGPIDSSLSKLQSLSVIRLDGNNLSGQFPEKIFQVCALKTLDLSGNLLLEGSLKEFLPASSLETLMLSRTSFGGTLPESIGNLGRLSRIELASCHFSGSIPKTMANLPQLVSLDLSSNNFSSPIPSFSFVKSLTQLNLAHNSLTGSILSTEWSGLSQLVSINLRDNALSGALPATLFGIPSLQSLVLSQNQFIGGLHEPPKLASSSLHSLELDSNMLDGPFPMFVFRLQSLRVLILAFNNFSGPLNFSSVLNLRDLSTLDLSFNSLSINANISNHSSFPQIHTLKLASCKLKRFPNFLKEQSKLSILDLSTNQINEEIPNWVWNAQSLSYLNLSHNFLVNLRGPLQLSEVFLSVLDLRGNKLQGPLPQLSPFMAYVDYSNNNFSSIIQFDDGNLLLRFAHLSLSSPSLIFLSNNSLRGSIPESICNAINLEMLDLSNNYLSGIIPQCLTRMKSLKVLDLSRNNLSGSISGKFSSNCLLQTLNLNGNHLKGKVPKSLANCAGLEVLNLGNNQINDTFPCHLKNISKLQVLVLRQNNFHGLISCPNDNSSWPQLQIIDLASNHFRGELPCHWLQTWKAMMVASDEFKILVLKDDFEVNFEFNNYEMYPTLWPNASATNTTLPLIIRSTLHKKELEGTNISQGIYYQDAVTLTIKGFERKLMKISSPFTSIDFSCNKFAGQIPEVLGEFKVLYALNLSHNGFTGLIPSSLGNLQHLESLDLSSNSLSGQIPQHLGDLHFLAVLNLSHNQLEGGIPIGSQFQTFSEDSFKDNKGLCGMPLKENCSVNGLPPSKDKHSDDGTHIDWNFLSIELGFVFGLGIVILPLMLYKRWRVWYCKHIDGLLSRFFPLLNQRSRSRGRRAPRSTKTQLRNKQR